MKRWIGFIPVLLLAACATVAPNVDTDKIRLLCLPDYGVEVPVPTGWTAARLHGDELSFFEIASPERDFLLLFTGTNPGDPLPLLASLRDATKNSGFKTKDVARTIDGLAVTGFVTTDRGPEEWLMLASHPRSVYMFMVRVEPDISAADRAAGFYLLDHMKLRGIDAGCPPESWTE